MEIILPSRDFKESENLCIAYDTWLGILSFRHLRWKCGRQPAINFKLQNIFGYVTLSKFFTFSVSLSVAEGIKVTQYMELA